MTYYIVEHPKRGILIDSETEGKPRFSYSITRVDPKVLRFYYLDQAQRIASAIKGAYVVEIERAFRNDKIKATILHSLPGIMSLTIKERNKLP